MASTHHNPDGLFVSPAFSQAVEVPAGELRDAVVEGAGELLESATLVDDYRGDGVEPGTKSVTLALRFRAADRTLTQAEATEAKMAGLALAATSLS